MKISGVPVVVGATGTAGHPGNASPFAALAWLAGIGAGEGVEVMASPVCDKCAPPGSEYARFGPLNARK